LGARNVEPNVMRSLESEERRKGPRHSLERMAKIELGYDAPPTYCIVTDISEEGVRLYLNGLEVPDEFVLLLSGDGPAKDGRYKVVWRQGDEVGAKYVS
jgi:PilZ domain